MTIEPIGPRWFSEVVQLWAEVGLTRPWNDPRVDLERAIGGAASTVLVSVEEGRLLATAMVGHDGHRGWVYYLAVRPGTQGRGHGRAMMGACESWLCDCGVRKLNVMVRGENQAVQGFYRSLGYASDDVLVFSRRLDEPAR